MVKSKLDGLNASQLSGAIDHCCSSLLSALGGESALGREEVLWQLEELVGKEYLVYLKLCEGIGLEDFEVDYIRGLIEKDQANEN